MDEAYKMGNTILGRTTKEKELGVPFSADMNIKGELGELSHIRINS